MRLPRLKCALKATVLTLINIFLLLGIFTHRNVEKRSERIEYLRTSTINSKKNSFDGNLLACRQPILSMENSKALHSFRPASGILPNCSKIPNWIKIVRDKIHFSPTALKRFSSIQCELKPIVRPSGEDFWVSMGDGFSFNERQNPRLVNDFFVVNCRSNSGENYSNYHLAIRSDVKLKKRHLENPISSNHLGYNVLILGFDSVSRISFMRFLPKSYSYLTNELDSIVMKGFNIVGDGTTPNMLALLTGHKMNELDERRRGKDPFTDRVIKLLANIEKNFDVCFKKKYKKLDLVSYLIDSSDNNFQYTSSNSSCNMTRELITWIKNKLAHEIQDIPREKIRNILISSLLEFKRNLFPNSTQNGTIKTIDHFPWIWNVYKKNGYITQWIEDWFSIGALAWRLTGFFDPPVDYYGRPFYVWTETQRPAIDDHCLGSITRYKAMLNWVNDLFLSYPSDKEKLFSFAFHKKYTHNSYDAFHYADLELLQFLRMFNKRREFERTILIFMTDHGARYSKARQSYQGRLEERMPFLSIRMPKKFQETHKDIMNNLRLNSDRLVTAFDIHETLLHISEFHSSSKYESKTKRSLSLFQLIPQKRTCADVAVAEHICACLNWRDVPTNDPLVVKFASNSVDYFNDFLSTKNSSSPCAILSLNRILEARILVRSEAWLRFRATPNGSYPNSSITNTYQIQFETKPGNGQFEITAAYNIIQETFDIQREHLSRINLYGKTSWCIAENRPEFRELCFCLNQE